VFRARDARDHYVARVEPSSGRAVLALVEDGVERELASGALPRTSDWQELVVEAVGDHLRVAVDGAAVIDHVDATLPAIGRSGMWAPAAAAASFDVFRVEPLGPGAKSSGAKDRS
jgi:hypothetical protein